MSPRGNTCRIRFESNSGYDVRRILTFCFCSGVMKLKTWSGSIVETRDFNGLVAFRIWAIGWIRWFFLRSRKKTKVNAPPLSVPNGILHSGCPCNFNCAMTEPCVCGPDCVCVDRCIGRR